MFIEANRAFKFLSAGSNNAIQFYFYIEKQKFSKDGYEEHMQVNHLAPALLAVLLLPSLIRGSPSRIVNVNSIVSSFLYLMRLLLYIYILVSTCILRLVVVTKLSLVSTI